MQIKQFTPTDHKIKALIYGPAGCGKTVFTGTATDVIFASAEGGLLSIADKKPSYVEIKSVKDLKDLYSFLKTQEHSYRTLVIDSITEINEIIKDEIEKKTGHAMQLQDWGTLSKEILNMFRGFRDLPMNVILVAQEQYITDEDKIKKIVPSLNGKAATSVAYFMDIVGYINIEADGTRWIETNTNRRLLTKDRSKLIGNNTKMEFSEWEKKIKKMDVGEEKITKEYQESTIVTAPVHAPKKTSPVKVTPKPVQAPIMVSSKIKDIQLELKRRGATDMESALKMLSDLTGGLATSFDMDDNTAEKWLVELLLIPDKTEEKEKKSPNRRRRPQKKSLLQQKINL